VWVSAEGHSDQSRGYEILDEAAMEAVKKWLFMPAMQGICRWPAPAGADYF